MVVLTAIIQANPGKENEVKELLTSLVSKVKQEEGVIEYKLHTAKSSPGKFFFYEKYKDQKTLDHHSSTPYFQDTFKKMDGLVSEDHQIEFYEEIASIVE